MYGLVVDGLAGDVYEDAKRALGRTSRRTAGRARTDMGKLRALVEGGMVFGCVWLGRDRIGRRLGGRVSASISSPSA
jgi:hypothetical protein